MSVKAMSWAWEQDVPMSSKGVLLALADHADNDGICWPGVRSVAEKCRMSPSTVRYHLRILRRSGLLFAEERKREDGSFTSNIYHLPVNILTPTLQSLAGYPSTDASTPSEPLIGKNHQGTIRESSLRERGARKFLPITPKYIEELVEEFSPQLGGDDAVREAIEEAMNHKAMDKRKDKRLYLRGWLRRDVERKAGSNGRVRSTRTEVDADPANFQEGKW